MTSEELFKFFFDYSLPVRQIVETKFFPLTSGLLNHKPSDESWSAAECFEHLLYTNGLYVPVFERISDNILKGYSCSGKVFKHTFMGKMIIKSVDPAQIKKYKSPKAFRIKTTGVRDNVLQQFLKQHEILLTKVMEFGQSDLQKIKIVSPASKFVRYNLGDCLMIIAYHNKRHIAQAERA